MERRRQLHGWVSQDALAAWQGFAEGHSTNVTALLEAIGRELIPLAATDLEDLPPFLAEALRSAWQIAGARSARSRERQQDR
jgi:hypothetical protein